MPWTSLFGKIFSQNILVSKELFASEQCVIWHGSSDRKKLVRSILIINRSMRLKWISMEEKFVENRGLALVQNVPDQGDQGAINRTKNARKSDRWRVFAKWKVEIPCSGSTYLEMAQWTQCNALRTTKCAQKVYAYHTKCIKLCSLGGGLKWESLENVIWGTHSAVRSQCSQNVLRMCSNPQLNNLP